MTIGTEIRFLRPGPGNPRNSEGGFIDLRNGNILFIYTRYYGSSGADHAVAELAAIESADGGVTFSEPRTVYRKRPDDLNVMSVSLLRLGNGDIGLFFLRKTAPCYCTPELMRSADEGKTWSEPVVIPPRKDYYVTNNDRVVRLDNGRILVPGNVHHCDFHGGHYDPGEGHCFISDDDGYTWRESECVLYPPFSDGSGLQETGFCDLGGGKVLGWCRSHYGAQMIFRSDDYGETFSRPELSRAFTSPESPMSIKRLCDGRLLSVFNPIPHYNGRNEGGSWGRTPLVCAVSDDNGETFRGTLALEDDPNVGSCYVAIHPLKDKVLLGYCNGGDTDFPLGGLKIKSVTLDELAPLNDRPAAAVCDFRR